YHSATASTEAICQPSASAAEPPSEKPRIPIFRLPARHSPYIARRDRIVLRACPRPWNPSTLFVGLQTSPSAFSYRAGGRARSAWLRRLRLRASQLFLHRICYGERAGLSSGRTLPMIPECPSSAATNERMSQASLHAL